MRVPFAKLFISSPFDGLQEHAEKVKECAWAFQQAIECHLSDECATFDEFRQEVVRLEHEADSVKRRIRGHLPKGTLLPVDKFQLFRYIREQDHVVDSVKDVLEWLSYRMDPGIPGPLRKDFLLLVDAVVEPIEELSKMVAEARKYFESFSEHQRAHVKEIIRSLREKEHDADKLESRLNQKIFQVDMDHMTMHQMFKIVEHAGAIADHAENAGDMMRAMIAR